MDYFKCYNVFPKSIYISHSYTEYFKLWHLVKSKFSGKECKSFLIIDWQVERFLFVFQRAFSIQKYIIDINLNWGWWFVDIFPEIHELFIFLRRFTRICFLLHNVTDPKSIPTMLVDSEVSKHHRFDGTIVFTVLVWFRRWIVAMNLDVTDSIWNVFLSFTFSISSQVSFQTFISWPQFMTVWTLFQRFVAGSTWTGTKHVLNKFLTRRTSPLATTADVYSLFFLCKIVGSWPLYWWACSTSWQHLILMEKVFPYIQPNLKFWTLNFGSFSRKIFQY